MPDLVVTVPQSFGLDQWAAEGDCPGEAWTGREYVFWLGGTCPKIDRGERVYIVYRDRLRGYAPLVRIEAEYLPRPGDQPHSRYYRYGLVRAGGAQAVTIPDPIRGFQGFRYRWWDRDQEIAFPDWAQP